MQAPFAMKFITPDQVAETMDGITEETYRELWGLMHMLPTITQDQIEECMTPADYAQIRCVAQVWDKLSEAAQVNIVAAVALEEKEVEA